MGEDTWWLEDPAPDEEWRCNASRGFDGTIRRCERRIAHGGLHMASTDERNAMAWGSGL